MRQTPVLTISQKEIKDKKKIKIRHDYILLALFGFLLGQAEVFPGLYPLSLIFWTMVIGNNKDIFTLITITTGLGLIWSGDYFNLRYLLAGIIGLLIFKLIRSRFKFYKLPLSVSVVHLLSSFLFNYFGQRPVLDYLLASGESIFIYILVTISLEGMKQFQRKKDKPTKLMIITLFIICNGVVIGLANLTVIPFQVVNIIIMLFIMGLAYSKGINYSIITASIFGLAMVSAGLIPIITMMRYIIIAFSCGLFHRKSKLWMILGVVLAFFIYSGFSPTIYDFKDSLIEFLISGLLFFIIPVKFWQYFYTELSQNTVNITNIEIDELNNSFKQHLTELAEVFNELSITFKEVLPIEDQQKRLNQFIYIFKNKICKLCQRHRVCWYQEKDDTYLKIKNMLEAGEKKGKIDKKIITEHLQDKCLYCEQIVSGTKACFELYKINSFWRDRLHDKQQIVSEQLAGVSEIINQFADIAKLTLKSNAYLNKIKKKALTSGIDLYNIEINSFFNSSRLNFDIEMEPCSGNNLCEDQLLTLLNTEYEQDFRILAKECGNKLKNKPCHLSFGSKGIFQLDIKTLQKSPSGNISGDSFLYKPLRDGKDLIVLSDGMGIGDKAAIESKAALNLLKKIIDSGFDQEIAIKTINSALYLRKEEEVFTTLDIAIFDTFTGEIVFNKIGAVSSYVKRGWDLIKIDSASLPAGILNKIEISSQSLKLKNNDFVIMLTDGVLDVRLDIKNREEWLIQLLKSSSFDKAKDVADYILSSVLADNKEIRDDMTIIVFKVQEISPKRRKFIF